MQRKPVLVVALCVLGLLGGIAAPREAAANPFDSLAERWKAFRGRSELLTCLTAAFAEISASAPFDAFADDASSQISDVVDQSRDRMKANFGAVMRGQLESLNVDSSTEANVDLALLTWREFSKLNPIATCFAKVIDRRTDKLRETVARVKTKMENWSVELFQEHVANKLHESIGQGLVKVLTQGGAVLSEEELSKIANVQYARFLIGQLKKSTSHLRAYTTGRDANARKLSWQDFAKTFFPTEHFPLDFQVSLGIEIVRGMAYHYIKDEAPGKGGYYINQALGLVQLAEGTNERVASSLCGLVPEAGAAICNATILQAMDAIWNQVVIPMLRSQVQTLLKRAVDEVVDRVKQRILDRAAASRTLAVDTGPMRILLDVLTQDLVVNLADVGTNELRRAIAEFGQAIVELPYLTTLPPVDMRGTIPTPAVPAPIVVTVPGTVPPPPAGMSSPVAAPRSSAVR